MNTTATRTLVGHVGGLRRYPVKSMQGESPERVRLGPEGLDGDRCFAVIDTETGRVASAKNPRKWGQLLNWRAELRDGVLVVTSPDGQEYRDDRDDLSAELSERLGRTVVVRGTPTHNASIEIQWPELAGSPKSNSETVEELPPGSYLDLAPVHLLTTATLNRLTELALRGVFDARRFRPNIVIETLPALSGFVEGGWVGRSLVIGNARLRITTPCSRCIMTTLAQMDLPVDRAILRAAAEHNSATVGVYATALEPAEVAAGDAVWLE